MATLGPVRLSQILSSSFQGHFMNKQLALIALMMIGAASAAKADETGLASIHDIKGEKGSRVCMSDHYHDGSGNGTTRNEAEAAARSSWMSFTIFEYGTDWGSYTQAASPKMDCSSASPKTWSCSTSARPCKKQGVAKTAKATKKSRSASR
jgi:hypothetical protein